MISVTYTYRGYKIVVDAHDGANVEAVRRAVETTVDANEMKPEFSRWRGVAEEEGGDHSYRARITRPRIPDA